MQELLSRKAKLEADLKQVQAEILKEQAPEFISNWFDRLDLDYYKEDEDEEEDEEIDESSDKFLNTQLRQWWLKFSSVEDIKIHQGYYTDNDYHIKFIRLDYFKPPIYHIGNSLFEYFVDSRGRKIDIKSLYPSNIQDNDQLLLSWAQSNYSNIIKYIILEVFVRKINDGADFDYIEDIGYTRRLN